MISQRAKASVEHLFIKSVKANLLLSKDDHCHVSQAQEDKRGKISQENILVQTISSFFFRLSVIFPIDQNASTTAYFSTNASGQTLEDVLAEFLNLVCGHMDRELSLYFPHLGMSTPYALGSECLGFLEETKPEVLCNYTIFINDSMQLGATICMTSWGPLDFDATFDAMAKKTEEAAGEIEFF